MYELETRFESKHIWVSYQVHSNMLRLAEYPTNQDNRKTSRVPKTPENREELLQTQLPQAML